MPSIVHSNLRQLTTQNKNWDMHLGEAKVSDYFGQSSPYDFSVDEKTILAINALRRGNYELFQEAINRGAVFDTPAQDATLELPLIQKFDDTCFQYKEQVEAYLKAGGPLFHHYSEFQAHEDGPVFYQYGNPAENNVLSMIYKGSSLLQYVDKNMLAEAYCKECFDEQGRPFNEKIESAHQYLFRYLFSRLSSYNIVPIDPASLAKMQEAGPLPNGLLYHFLTSLNHTQSIQEKSGFTPYTAYINDCLKVFGQDQYDTLHYSSYREQKEKMPAMEFTSADFLSLEKTTFTLEEEGFLFTLLAERFLDPQDNPFSKETAPLFDFSAWKNSNREEDLFPDGSAEQALFHALLFHYVHNNPNSPMLQHIGKWQKDPSAFMTDLIYHPLMKRGTVFEIIAEPLPNGTYSTQKLMQQPWSNVDFLDLLAQYGACHFIAPADYRQSSSFDEDEAVEYTRQSFSHFIRSDNPEQDYEKEKAHIEHQISQLKTQPKKDGSMYEWQAKLFFLNFAYNKYDLFKQFEALPGSTLKQVWAKLHPSSQMAPFAQLLHERILSQSILPATPTVPEQRLSRF